MQTINQWIGAVSDVVWGLPIIVLLLGTGIYLTVLLRGLQFRQLGPALHLLGPVFHLPRLFLGPALRPLTGQGLGRGGLSGRR